MTALRALSDLNAGHPEWTPWLEVIAQLLSEIANPEWASAVPHAPQLHAPGVPLLAGAVLRPHARIGAAFEGLKRIAAAGGAPAMGRWQLVPSSETLAREVFRAALNGDHASLERYAADSGIEAEAFGALAALLPMPFLHASAQRWAGAIPQGWSQGYCPCCGAWPALTEVCGIERSRYLRCGRCGSAWRVSCLACPYCGTNEHQSLASMVPEQSSVAKAVIEVCMRCRGYVKVTTMLLPSPPATVLLDDLASVELDIAASKRGFLRPHGFGYGLNVTMDDTRPGA